MKILFLTPSFLPHLGGVEKHVAEVSKILSDRGNHVSVLTVAGQRGEEELKGVRVIRIGFRNHPFRRGAAVLRCLGVWLYLLARFSVLQTSEIIHLHDFETFLWVLPFLAFTRNRTFITFHGFEQVRPSRTSRIVRKVADSSVRGNLCIGGFIKKWYGTEPDYVLFGGVSLPNRNIAVGSPHKAVFVGRLTEDTAVMQYLESCLILKEELMVEMEVHICGDGPLRSSISDYAGKNGLGVTLHGFVANPDRIVDMCGHVFASGYLTILEGMVRRKPVYSIWTSQLKRDYLYSIPQADDKMFISSSTRELADFIGGNVKAPDQAKPRVDRAYEFALGETWEKVASTYLALYQDKRGR